MPRKKQYEDYYEYLGNYARCKACNKLLKRSGENRSSTGLLRHLRAIHPRLFESYSTATEGYEVEYIMGDADEGNVKIYKVKWRGFDVDDWTWEPSFHLTEFQVHVDAYNFNKEYYAAHLIAEAVLFG